MNKVEKTLEIIAKLILNLMVVLSLPLVIPLLVVMSFAENITVSEQLKFFFKNIWYSL